MFFRKVFNNKKTFRAPLDFLQIFGISAKDAAENGVDLDCNVILKYVRADENDFWGSFVMGVTSEIQQEKGFDESEICLPLRQPYDKRKFHPISIR